MLTESGTSFRYMYSTAERRRLRMALVVGNGNGIKLGTFILGGRYYYYIEYVLRHFGRLQTARFIVSRLLISAHIITSAVTQIRSLRFVWIHFGGGVFFFFFFFFMHFPRPSSGEML